MKIKILSSALEDLHAGRQFYDKQGEGVGEYFFDGLFSDIDSLALYAGIPPQVFGYHRLLGQTIPIRHILQVRGSSDRSSATSA